MKKRVTIPIRVEPVDGKRIDGEWMVGWQVRWASKRTYRALEDLNLLEMKLSASAFDRTYLPCPESDPLVWRRVAT